VSSFRLERDGTVTARFDVAEIALIAELGTQLTELLSGRSDDDPALRRLIPDAYPDDAEASAEFRRFTADGLIERKLAGTSALLASIGSATPDGAAADTMATLHLDPPAVQAWLRSIGDLRLTIATRLGIERDGDEGSPGDPLADLYDWLGYVQGSLVDALDAGDAGEAGVPDA
jgi:hypothetical protein